MMCRSQFESNYKKEKKKTHANPKDMSPLSTLSILSSEQSEPRENTRAHGKASPSDCRSRVASPHIPYTESLLTGWHEKKRRLKRTLKSSRACAPRLSLRASALYIVCLQLIRRFCNSSASTRSEFQTMPRSYSCKKAKKFNPWQD